MNKPTLLISILLSLTVAFSAHAHEAHCEDTKLGELMSQMKKATKKLNKSAKRENFDQINHWNDTLKRLAKESYSLTPLKLKADDSLDLANYRKRLDKMQAILDDITQAATTKKIDTIESSIEELNKLKKTSHKRFRLDCD